MRLCVFFPPSFSNADQSQTCSDCIQSSRLSCWGLLQSSVGLLKPWQKNLEVLTFQKSFSRTKQDKTAQKRYLTREKNKAPKRQPKGFGFSFLFFFFFKGRDQIKHFFFWRISVSSSLLSFCLLWSACYILDNETPFYLKLVFFVWKIREVMRQVAIHVPIPALSHNCNPVKDLLIFLKTTGRIILLLHSISTKNNSISLETFFFL